jgi:hypothetical protein
MNKVLAILGVALVVTVLAVYFLKTKNKQSQPSIITSTTNISMTSTNQVTTVTNAVVITEFENISDFKKIPSLKLLQQYTGTQSWISYHTSVPFQLQGQNDRTFVFNADFIDSEIIATNGRVQSLELQSSYMNIDEIQAFGLQLCAFLSIDPKNFLAWCDKVGNRWLDQPLFYSGAGASPSSNKIMAFNIRHTFNNEKPWYIDFIFQDK